MFNGTFVTHAHNAQIERIAKIIQFTINQALMGIVQSH
jgi:hypothetical protein